MWDLVGSQGGSLDGRSLEVDLGHYGLEIRSSQLPRLALPLSGEDLVMRRTAFYMKAPPYSIETMASSAPAYVW